MLQFSGSPKTWYGRFDILIGHNKIPCSDVEKDEGKQRSEEPSTEEQSISELNGMSQIEVKTTPLQDSRSQLLAECITCSFLRKKYSAKVNLVPSIGVSKSSIQFYFYDCQNDVFLQSPELPLYEDKNEGDYRLKLFTIMATWLVLNYNFLMTGITENMKSERFGFHTIGACLEFYRKDLEYGHVTPVRPSQFTPWFDSHRTFSCIQSDMVRY